MMYFIVAELVGIITGSCAGILWLTDSADASM